MRTNIDFRFFSFFRYRNPMAMATTTKGKRPLRHLTASDKIEAIQRIHDGESKASVARDIGVPESTLRGWCKNEEKLRYMSRQAGPPDSKMGIVDKLTEKMTEDALAAAAVSGFLSGPSEKRAKLDTSLPMGFGGNGSSKVKYEDFATGRASLGGLDFSDKGLGALNFSLNSDYGGYKTKNDFTSPLKGKSAKDYANTGSYKGFGADFSKPSDPTKADMSMAAISPLSSLTHLSGFGQSPLAMSFNEVVSNLSLLAQFNNSNLSAMSGLAALNGTATNSSSIGNASNNNLRSVRPKTMSSPSPRSGSDDKSSGLTVKNLAKLQKTGTDLSGLGIDLLEKAKKPTTGNSMGDDNLWYWVKQQQQMLGLNSMFSGMPTAASPHRSSPVIASGHNGSHRHNQSSIMPNAS